MRVLNSRFLLQFRHQTKIACVAISWAAGLVLFYASYYLGTLNKLYGFLGALVSTLLIGSFTSVGDGTIIGFMKAIPADNIAGWSSGTGFAGIFGSGLYLLLRSFKLNFGMVRMM